MRLPSIVVEEKRAASSGEAAPEEPSAREHRPAAEHVQTGRRGRQSDPAAGPVNRA